MGCLWPEFRLSTDFLMTLVLFSVTLQSLILSKSMPCLYKHRQLLPRLVDHHFLSGCFIEGKELEKLIISKLLSMWSACLQLFVHARHCEVNTQSYSILICSIELYYVDMYELRKVVSVIWSLLGLTKSGSSVANFIPKRTRRCLSRLASRLAQYKVLSIEKQLSTEYDASAVG